MGTLSLADPARRGPRGADAWQIGPPQFIREASPISFLYHDMAWMPGHRALAVNDNANDRVLLVDLTNPNPAASQPAVLRSEHGRMATVAVSPDGQ